MPTRFFGLIPAAGAGARFGGRFPKQYTEVHGRTLLWFAVRALLADARIDTVFVVLAPGDETFRRQDWSAFGDRLAPLYCGGATRAESVRSGLICASDAIDLDDWVLVHDAARPCLGAADLARLIDTLARDAVGGILAAPLADTLKRADADERVAATEPREGLWRAQTPQMFRLGTLLRALDAARDVTDESAAVEAMGLKPRLVSGSAANIKVTYPEDVTVAAALLASADGPTARRA
ncbi:MAG: 2-C-methyl-D-erythritol 4-phosphate cytidylyltransferase [Burkholderiales bacterium]|jgi:2-C-methyl-D-erythritol 4-phosphate cytidylyltransferase|nr:2-C-methyl-D-erythritol 4-phosphate cytidylyltransferase [Burkholderiales bacterium]